MKKFIRWIKKLKITEFTWGVLIIFISIIIPFCSKYLKPEPELSQKIIIGLFTGILGILIRIWFLMNRYQEIIVEQVKRNLVSFGDIVRSLVRLQESQKDRRGVILLGESLKKWLEYTRKEDSKFADSNNLWSIVFEQYMKEEVRDISSRRVATNIEIYTELLSSFVSYYIERYQKDAVIFIVTSLLPSQWYNPETWIAGFDRVEDYRRSLEEIIRQKRKEGLIVRNYKRHIAVQSSQNLRGFSLLAELGQESKETLKKYINDLHFEHSDPQKHSDQLTQAYFFDINNPRGFKGEFQHDLKDLLLFGYIPKGTDKPEYTWGIQSDMDPAFPAMFITLYDPSQNSLGDVKIFSKVSLQSFISKIEFSRSPLKLKLQAID
jgi:hypothetical protein